VSLEYKFDHVHVIASDRSVTEKWFLDGLGAELVERRDSRGVPVSEVRLGGVHVLIRGVRNDERFAPAAARQYGADHVGLRVADVDAAVEELRRRGVVIEVEPWDFGPDLRIAFVKGPDNIRVELVQPR
jgi:lactoylglutathione lyase